MVRNREYSHYIPLFLLFLNHFCFFLDFLRNFKQQEAADAGLPQPPAFRLSALKEANPYGCKPDHPRRKRKRRHRYEYQHDGGGDPAAVFTKPDAHGAL